MKKVNIKNPEELEKVLKLYDEMVHYFWPIVGTANHMAMSSMFDAYDLLESRQMLSFSVKKNMNSAAKMYDRYLQRVRHELKDRFPLWSDVTRLISSKMQPQADDLQKAIRHFFEVNKVEDTELRAQTCITDALIQNACVLYDTYVERFQKQTTVDISSNLKYARMTGVYNAFRQVSKNILRTNLPYNVNVNNDLDCYQALENLLSRFRDMDSINEACRQAIDLNPEMMKYVKKEDQHFFKKK